jgi:hypothetical protein
MPRSGKARLTLRPGDPGTKRLTEEYREKLVAVRYRYDERHRRRYTTVELIVEDAPWVPERHISDPDRLVGLRIGWEEKAHQAQLRGVHARWDPAAKLWWLALHLVTQLGLEERIAEWASPREGISSKV